MEESYSRGTASSSSNQYQILDSNCNGYLPTTVHNVSNSSHPKDPLIGTAISTSNGPRTYVKKIATHNALSSQQPAADHFFEPGFPHIQSEYRTAVTSGLTSLGIDVPRMLGQQLTDQHGFTSNLTSRHGVHGRDHGFYVEDSLPPSYVLGPVPVPHYKCEWYKCSSGEAEVQHDLMGIGSQFHSN